MNFFRKKEYFWQLVVPKTSVGSFHVKRCKPGHDPIHFRIWQKICQVVTICKNFKNSSQISCADQEKSVIKVSVVRLKARKLGAQSKFIQFLELYISESTNPRNLEFYRLNLASRLLNNTKAISRYIMATQKHKKNCWQRFFAFLNSY